LFCADVDRPEDMFPGYTPKKEKPDYTSTVDEEPK
jgi:hypothetical protein